MKEKHSVCVGRREPVEKTQNRVPRTHLIYCCKIWHGKYRGKGTQSMLGSMFIFFLVE